MTVNHFPFHIGDFLGGTIGMDATETGAYVMLLVAHYQAGVDGLSDDDVFLARVARVSAKVWKSIRPRISEKFSVSGGRWKQERVVEELRKIEQLCAQNSAKALKQQEAARAAALPQHSQPIANSQEPITVAVEARVKPSVPHVEVGKEIGRITGLDKDPRWFGDYSRVAEWLQAGWDAELDIYPTVRKLMGKRSDPPRSLKYFEQAIADAYASRMKPIPEGKSNAEFRGGGRQGGKSDRARAAVSRALDQFAEPEV